MVRRPPWSRAPVGVGVGVLFLALASQLSQPTFISARQSGQNLRPARAAATPAAAQASAHQPQQLTAFPSLALSLLACSALRYAATRKAGLVSKGAPRARCVLNAMASPAPGATVKAPEDWQSAEPQAQPPKEPLISLEPEVLNELKSSDDLTAGVESAFGSRSGEGRRRPAEEARGRRQCGARLLRACSAAPQSWPDGKSAAMDMSRVRSKIQVGIRCTSSARTGSNGREAKTRPECAPIGCCDGHKVRVECCSFTRRSRENGTSSN
mmetsp:Transcript_18161/g.30701  ORF Transcript_18161/g.30701 Transcript_18161/m.30701 type:complete len:268 (+) Transcript_18161:70-873(+)